MHDSLALAAIVAPAPRGPSAGLVDVEVRVIYRLTSDGRRRLQRQGGVVAG